MIPVRLAVEYPERCLRLLEELEPSARKPELVGSFSILVASSAILIPYERMQSRHQMHRKERDSDLVRLFVRSTRGTVYQRLVLEWYRLRRLALLANIDGRERYARLARRSSKTSDGGGYQEHDCNTQGG
jgi:hypothetical protein